MITRRLLWRLLPLSVVCFSLIAATVGAEQRRDDRRSRHRWGRVCRELPTWAQLKDKLEEAVAEEGTGFQLQMWATLVDRDGIVCAIAFTGNDRGDQWPGSRVISAQKANTANAFGLNGLALSTANLYSAVQPGGSLFGLQESNPVDTGAAYAGPSIFYGKSNDPLVGHKVGGVNVFGGGLGLYDERNGIVGGVGVSGDSSCRDHNVAWLLRNKLELDDFDGVGGVSGDPARPDNIVFDITPNPGGGTGKSTGGWGHPTCTENATDSQNHANALPAVFHSGS